MEGRGQHDGGKLANHSPLRKWLGSNADHRYLTDRRIGLLVLAFVVLGALGLGLAFAWHRVESSKASPVAAVSSAIPTHCRSLRGLPDPGCTPGVADPRVTQDNIHSTVCVNGYSASVRPPSAYTDALKRGQIIAYGYADTNPADYEEDHLIPLELGGHPTDPKNLWPQPRVGTYSASQKDMVENSLHLRVCTGSISLKSAQVAIAGNWESAIS